MAPDTILVTDRSTIRSLCGFTGTAGFVVLHKDKGYLFTDARYHLVARKVLPPSYTLIDLNKDFPKVWAAFLKKRAVSEIGYEGYDLTVEFLRSLRRRSKGVRFRDVGTLIRQRRIQKTQAEIKLLARAQEITDEVFSMMKKKIKVGMSELDISWMVELLARECGAEGISFPPIVGFKENSASPHHHCSERKLKAGELILIDMGVLYKGYCSDMTRMLFTKEPTPEEQKIYTIVREAQELAISKIKAGVTGVQADGYARSLIEEAGYGSFFTHSLGHGVGLDVHELPNLSPSSKPQLPEKSIVTVEPGIYLEGKFGVRLEDMVVVEKNGVKNLTKSSKEITDCIIKA
ncbi:hypothetical protein CO046_05280 [Candidatus Peregrinibacteria bacterium CG_4_9_14_0_2_um_filter_53_11]|nr:MAG: hypothetical protein CO046_05280 [Candidatus Peregrinibacteria bacterium CG_4_9_14_0_2_um_filter_53_11]